jgi:hypothetical protein
MNAPKTVKIGALNYDVEFEEKLISGGDVLFGHHLFDEIKMKIGSSYPVTRQKEALLHECLHAIDERYLAGSLEEKQITSLGYGVFDFIRNNKDVVKWLMEDEE